MELVHRVEFIKKLCIGRKVLHLGCTNWPYTQDSIENDILLHNELGEISKDLYGFDFDQAGIDILEKAGTRNLYRADLEKLDQVNLTETFELIIAGEIIEHLSNPGLFLRGIQRFMNSETRLVITTVNAYAALRFFLYGLAGKKGVNEPVHPDHVAYYSYKTLKLMIERSGLEMTEFKFYDLGPEHRPFNPWYLNLVNDIAVSVSRQLCDGVIAVCKLSK